VQAASLHDLLAALAQRGLLEILFEGGPTLAGALLADDLIDRVALFVAPLVVGRGAPDLVALPAVEAPADGLRLTDVTWTRHGDDILCRGRVARGEEAAEAVGGAAAAPGRAVEGAE
jgi:diaminohydroxyphosphoribosylaminopyrimidine deaminase/5-amino-6-(5-phosphoribosylamino)uracil reductase